MFTIQKNVPMPENRDAPAVKSELFGAMLQMEVGDSIFLPEFKMNKATAKTSEFRRRHRPLWTFKHSSVKEDEIEGVRIWRGEDRENSSVSEIIDNVAAE